MSKSMKCYVLSKNNIENILMERFWNIGHPELPDNIGKDKTTRRRNWLKAKSVLVEDKSKIKKYKDIEYLIVKAKSPEKFIIFAIGDDKKDTLTELYLKTLEELKKGVNLDKSPDELAKGKKAETNINNKEEQTTSTKTENTWDLSDESKNITEHLKAILSNKYTITGEFNNEQSEKVLKSIGTSKEFKEALANKHYKQIPIILTKSVKAFEKPFQYTIFDVKKIQNLIKDLADEVEKSTFEEEFNNLSVDDQFDLNEIKK